MLLGSAPLVPEAAKSVDPTDFVQDIPVISFLWDFIKIETLKGDNNN